MSDAEKPLTEDPEDLLEMCDDSFDIEEMNTSTDDAITGMVLFANATDDDDLEEIAEFWKGLDK